MEDGEHKRDGEGCFVSPLYLVLGVLLSAAMATGVGIMVHFGQPGMRTQCVCQQPLPTVPPSYGPNESLRMCTDLATKLGRCICPPETSPLPPTTQAPFTDFRLPNTLKPAEYSLELKPDFYGSDPTSFTFEGKVNITFECKVSTDIIILHFFMLNVTNSENMRLELVSGPPDAIVPYLKPWELDERRQFLKIPLSSRLTEGATYRLTIPLFRGPLISDFRGIYLSSYLAKGQRRYLMTSHLHPTDARKVFPCFDEPAMKAVFKLTLLRKGNTLKSVSNADLAKSEERSDGWFADVFNPTPPMSTYLLAMSINDFEYKEIYHGSNGTHLSRVIARSDAMRQGQYALSLVGRHLDFLEDYFGIPYPMAKTDHIAVPDINVGAMENWGLVMYRESNLLYNPDVSSANNRYSTCNIIAHELVHQWFGNLMTMSWWDDTWLSEGFATYAQYLGINNVYPDWKPEELMIVRTVQSIMRRDSLASSHPIFYEVKTPDQINAIFDGITYSKGASVIRMLRYFLGEGTFKKGLTNFLNETAYSNAHHTQLYAALTAQAKSEGREIDVKRIMDTWVLQMGYPVVTISRTGNFGNAEVTQNYFRTDPSQPIRTPGQFGYKWHVPVTYVTQRNKDWRNPRTLWLEMNNKTLPDLPKDEWVLANIWQTGFYRVNYDRNNWEALVQQLIDNHTEIHVINRAQLLDDSFNLGRSEVLDQITFLETTRYLAREQEYIPWTAALSSFNYIAKKLVSTQYYGALERYMRERLRPVYDHVGWNDTEAEPVLTQFLRSSILEGACRYGYQPCREKAAILFQDWMANPAVNPIRPNLKSVTYCYALMSGEDREWSFAWNMYKTANLATEKNTLLNSLACTRKPFLIDRYLSKVLNESEVRQGNVGTVISQISMHPMGQSMAWNWVRANWDTLRKRYGSTSFTFSRLIQGVTNGFSTTVRLNELEELIRQNPDAGTGTAALQQALESTKANIKWRQENEQIIGEWLLSNAPSVTLYRNL